MKKIFFFILILLFVANKPVFAKTLPQAQKSVGKISIGKPDSSVTVSVKLRRDRQALNVFFGNLKSAQSISYTLIYTTNGKQEGVAGSINLKGQTSTSRELLFGTCSSGVCRYHSHISNMSFEVSIQATSGKTILKRYHVKV